MKKVLGLAVLMVFIASLITVAACSKAGGKDAILGTWAMVDSPGKTVKITKEGANYFYEGSQGKTPATLQNPNTLVVPMGQIQVTVKLDPATSILTVAFMGETYKYKKAQ